MRNDKKFDFKEGTMGQDGTDSRHMNVKLGDIGS